MFEVFCPEEKIRVLLSASSILSMNKSSNGIEVHYLCDCGHKGILQTGRRVSFGSNAGLVKREAELQMA